MASTYLRSVLGPSFDVEVMEIHHRMKRDAPSGTALKVVEDLLTPGSTIVTAREGLRRSGEVGVVSLRGGDVAGEHTVFFLGDGERIEVTQRVQSRSVFGAGAVVLVDRLATRSPGLYDVRHLLEVGR
jgi:4-hydroxy-tetrahydrodipicolinate reductase